MSEKNPFGYGLHDKDLEEKMYWAKWKSTYISIPCFFISLFMFFYSMFTSAGLQVGIFWVLVGAWNAIAYFVQKQFIVELEKQSKRNKVDELYGRDQR